MNRRQAPFSTSRGSKRVFEHSVGYAPPCCTRRGFFFRQNTYSSIVILPATAQEAFLFFRRVFRFAYSRVHLAPCGRCPGKSEEVPRQPFFFPLASVRSFLQLCDPVLGLLSRCPVKPHPPPLIGWPIFPSPNVDRFWIKKVADSGIIEPCFNGSSLSGPHPSDFPPPFQAPKPPTECLPPSPPPIFKNSHPAPRGLCARHLFNSS